MVMGFVEGGDEMTADNLNRLLNQWGTLANRPTASSAIEGVTYTATDRGKVYQVQSGSWAQLQFLDVNDITTGTSAREDFLPFSDESAPNDPTRKDTIEDILGLMEEDDVPDLDADKITSGEFDEDRIPDLSTDKITSDTLDRARIPTSIRVS